MEKKEKFETINENSVVNTEATEMSKLNDTEIAVKPKEPLAEIMGEIGKWQVKRILVVFLIGIPGIAHVFSAAFIAAKTDYWCKDELTNNWSNYTIDTLPKDILSSKNATLLCASECKEYGFDHTFWEDTLISQFSLVCEGSYYSVLAKMIFFGGFAVGTFGAGIISDLYGRKSAIMLMAQLLFGCGILTAAMRNMVGFTIMWFFTGIAAMGTYTVCFVWAMESVSGRWKTFISTFMNFGWPIARLGIAGVAALSRDWKSMLQWISAVHIITPLLMHFVPESTRWLLASAKPERRIEAKAAMKEASIANEIYNQDTDAKIDALIHKDTQSSNTKKSQGFLSIFRSRIMAQRTLIMYYNWFTNSFILYGLGLNWQALTGSLFTNFMIGAAMDFPAKTLAAILVIKCGRRWPYIACLIGSGVGFLLMLAFNKGDYENDWPIVACAMVGNFFISTSFAIIWVYTAELYPTTIRNAALGSCSLVARIGGVFSNLVGKLAEYHVAIPTTIFGVSALLAAFLSLFLPETAGHSLPDTIEECEREFNNKTRRSSHHVSRRCSSIPK